MFEELNAIAQLVQLIFERADAITTNGFGGSRRCHLRHLAREQMRIAGFFHAALPLETGDEWRVVLGEPPQTGFHFVEIAELVHALGSGPELTDGLRSADHEL